MWYELGIRGVDVQVVLPHFDIVLKKTVLSRRDLASADRLHGQDSDIPSEVAEVKGSRAPAY